MWPERVKRLASDFVREWLRAEEVLKRFERLAASAFMPSVQELRYAGRRFMQALELLQLEANQTLTPTESEDIEKHLIEAVENCVKARHDAVDAAVQFIHKRMNLLVNAVGRADVIRHFPQFSLLQKEISEIDRKIIHSRKDRSIIDEQYEAILNEHSEKLLDFYGMLEESEFAIRSAIKAQNHKNFRNLIISSLVGFLLGIASSFVAAWMANI